MSRHVIIDDIMVKKMFGEKNPFDFVENSAKQEMNFKPEDYIKMANSRDELLKILAIDKKEISRLKHQNARLRYEKHIYKVEMERLRKKITRLYRIIYMNMISILTDEGMIFSEAEKEAKSIIDRFKRMH